MEVARRNISDESLINELLSADPDKVEGECKSYTRARPKLCDDKFWVAKTKTDYGEEALLFNPYRNKYYNYLAARVRAINKQIKDIRRSPNFRPEDLGRIRLDQLELLSEEDLRNLAFRIDNEFIRRGKPSLELAQEESYYDLLSRLTEYFITSEERVAEILPLEEKANNTSFKIAKYVRGLFPDHFRFIQITRQKLPVGRYPVIGNRNWDDLILIKTPYNEMQLFFSTQETAKIPEGLAQEEVVNFTNERRELPSLFVDFLQIMGLTYEAAEELYGYRFEYQASENWI